MGTSVTGQSAASTAARHRLIGRLRSAMQADAVRDALRRDWEYARVRGLEVRECELVRIHPRGDDAFVLEYEVNLAGQDVDQMQTVLAELAFEDAETRYQAACLSLQKSKRKQLKAREVSEYLTCLSGLDLVVRLPGLDERLPGLKLYRKTRRFGTEVIEGLAGAEPGSINNLSAELLGHRLGRRCTVRFRFDCDDALAAGFGGRSLIAKMYKLRGRGADVARLMGELRAAGFDGAASCRLPTVIGYVDEWSTMFMEDVPALPLSRLDGDALASGSESAGRILAKLHGCAVSPGLRHTVADETAILERWVGLVAEVHPELGAQVLEAIASIRRGLTEAADAPLTLVHRDFYEQQVLIADDRAVLIDFDTLCLSDAAIDVGNFIAHLRLARVQRGVDASRVTERFLAGYGEPRDSRFAERVDAYVRATLLRLACLYSFWPRLSHVVEPLLAEL